MSLSSARVRVVRCAVSQIFPSGVSQSFSVTHMHFWLGQSPRIGPWCRSRTPPPSAHLGDVGPCWRAVRGLWLSVEDVILPSSLPLFDSFPLKTSSASHTVSATWLCTKIELLLQRLGHVGREGRMRRGRRGSRSALCPPSLSLSLSPSLCLAFVFSPHPAPLYHKPLSVEPSRLSSLLNPVRAKA